MSEVAVPLGGSRAAGRVALVDGVDAWVLAHGWSVSKRGYVQAKLGKRVVTLHRLIMDFPPGLVDHINRDRLDCRRRNLRVVGVLENSRNRGPKMKGNYTSRHRGVYRHTQTGRWVATGCLNGRSVYIGSFIDEQEAANAAEDWRREHYLEVKKK